MSSFTEQIDNVCRKYANESHCVAQCKRIRYFLEWLIANKKSTDNGGEEIEVGIILEHKMHLAGKCLSASKSRVI